MSATGVKHVIGIDLGTSYCSVAIVQNGIVKVLEDEQGKRRIPSYVAFTGNEYLVGQPAMAQAHANPDNTVFGVKRLLGCQFEDDNEFAKSNQWMPFKVIVEDRNPKIQVTYGLEKRTFTPQEITALLLMKMKEMAESSLENKVSHAVISVPANFNYLQRNAIVDAARIAGLGVLQLISEPTAAALAYFAEKKVIDERNMIIFDFGGGSLDVSLVSFRDKKLEVKAVSGEAHLGGEDFDNNLLNNMTQKYDSTNLRFLSHLKQSCRTTKEALSSLPEHRIQIDDVNAEMVDRDWFNSLNEELFQKIESHVSHIVREAREMKIGKCVILLVGGSTRIHQIEGMLKEKCKDMRISRGVNRDEAVAIGAAVQAAIILGEKSANLSHLKEPNDILSKSLNIVPKDSGLEISIPAYCKLPTSEAILKFDLSERKHVSCRINESLHTDCKRNLLETIQIGIAKSSEEPENEQYAGLKYFVDRNGILQLFLKNLNEKFEATKTSDHKGLSEYDIQIMIETVKKLNDDRDCYKDTMQKRNSLEGVVNHLQRDIKTNKHIPVEVKTQLLSKCGVTLDWLQDNEQATKEDLQNKLEDFQKIRNAVNSIPGTNEANTKSYIAPNVVHASSESNKYNETSGFERDDEKRTKELPGKSLDELQVLKIASDPTLTKARRVRWVALKLRFIIARKMDASKEEQRGIIRFLTAEGVRQTDIHRRMVAVNGEHSLSLSVVKGAREKLKGRRFSLDNESTANNDAGNSRVETAHNDANRPKPPARIVQKGDATNQSLQEQRGESRVSSHYSHQTPPNDPTDEAANSADDGAGRQFDQNAAGKAQRPASISKPLPQHLHPPVELKTKDKESDTVSETSSKSKRGPHRHAPGPPSSSAQVRNDHRNTSQDAGNYNTGAAASSISGEQSQISSADSSAIVSHKPEKEKSKCTIL